MSGWQRSRVLFGVLLVASLAGCSATAPAPTPGSTADGSGATSTSATPTPPATAGPTSSAASAAPWLAYQTAEGTPHIRLVRLDGSDDHELVQGSHPDWSPDGSTIAYQVDDRDMWVIGVDGRNARRVFECADPCALGDSAAWSPDGNELAFLTANVIDHRAPNGWIVAVDVATGAKRTLLETKGPDYPAYPRWSPDGKSIVVSIQRFATTGETDCVTLGTAIGIVDLTAPKPSPRVLTAFSLFGDYPDWSPDGQSIVFNTIDQGRRDFSYTPADGRPKAPCTTNVAKPSDVYVVKTDGTGLTQLTHNAAGTKLIRELDGVGTASGPLATQPTWTPDGKGIVFTFVDGPTWPGYQVWTMDANGQSAHSIFDPMIVGSHARIQPVGS